MKKCLFLLFIYFLLPSIQAQEIGEWNTHFSYESRVNLVLEGHGVVYAVSDGKLFSYNPEEDTFQVYHKVNGEDIILLEYSEKHECLIIVRKNSDIDFLYENGKYINIPDLKNSTLNINKSVNHISIHEDEAYLSTDFGLLILNLEKREVKETVLFRFAFHSTVYYQEKIVAATDEGVLRVDPKENMQYRENWEEFSLRERYTGTSDDWQDEHITTLTVFNDKLFFLINNEAKNYKALYTLDNNTVESVITGAYPEKLINAQDRLILFNPFTLWTIYYRNNILDLKSQHITDSNLNYIIPRQGTEDEYWISWYSGRLSYNKNLSHTLYNREDNSFEDVETNLRPQGPLSNDPFSMTYQGGKLLVSGGGYDGNRYGIAARLSEYEEGIWFNYDKTAIDNAVMEQLNLATYNARDFVSAITDPNDPDHIYVASWGDGLYEFKNKEFVKLYNETNSTLELSSPGAQNNLRINGMTFDKQGNLWLQKSYSPNKINVLKADGKWVGLNYPEIEDKVTYSKTFLIDQYNNKWISTIRGDDRFIFIFDDNGTLENTADDQTKLITSFYDQDGEALTIIRINALVEDKKGNIWVGTDNGVFVIYNSYNIFSRNIVLNKIKIPATDGSVEILLRNAVVNDIKVDGGNRKWIATGTGVYIVSEDGTESIHTFTMENSLLPSNTILSLAIDPETGIVYMGSDKGIVSYKGEATEGATSFSNVYVYPNPVRPDYEGPITITGLKENSNVKITDIKGNLIHQGTSLGGQYSWDGKNVRREKVKTGVYLVFGASEDGKNGAVAKIMVVSQ